MIYLIYTSSNTPQITKTKAQGSDFISITARRTVYIYCRLAHILSLAKKTEK